ncbi:MAG: hypothetical protein KF689_02440 [Gemmatimonadaceae bacterium]|nr:hypothetical protein [Gemmatimonadaceae bacterium]MCW5826795.1 hypothetical protein [Gemmatimonadaceae bacterium]
MFAAALSGSAAGQAAASPQHQARDAAPAIPESLRGHSGQLRAYVAAPAADTARTIAAGPSEPPTLIPPVYTFRDSAGGGVFHFITLLPFDRKRDGRVGAYRVGRWPAERRPARSPQDALPAGFIAVTPEMQSLMISTHFTLGDFLPERDAQAEVWPKPLVLELRLVDKLELILTALRDSGIAAPRLRMMSAFRTPNVTLGGARTALSPDSRHQYGDAADFIVDADGDGRLDDLDRDGRRDLGDARWLVRVIRAIEAEHPDLVGGIGVYRRDGGNGHFLHVDTRGERARWGLQ